MSLLGLVHLVRYILAGLDQRYGWTGGLPVAVQLAALALCVLGLCPVRLGDGRQPVLLTDRANPV